MTARHQLRVCQVVDRLSGGGQERVAATLASQLVPNVTRSALLATRGGGDYESMLEAVDLHLGARSKRLQARAWLPQVRWLRREPFDILHTHNPGSLAAIATLRRLRLVSGTIVSHIQMLPPRDLPYRAAAERWHRRHRSDIAASIVTNDGLKNYLVTRCGYDEGSVFVLPNPVDFDASPRPVRSETPTIAVVAQWRAQKDQECAIRAAGLLRDRGVSATWLFVGDEDPVLTTRASNLVAELGLAGVVEIMGRRTDVPELLATASVGVLPTHFEGYPVALVEYAAAGLPIVVSAVEGTRHLVSPDDGIIGVPVADPEAIADAVAHLIAAPGRAAALGERARRKMRAACHTTVVLEQLLDIYERARCVERQRR
jgi:glycosyltransferase involved in cell wall biosynthesis